MSSQDNVIHCAEKVTQYSHDTETALLYARKTAEAICRDVYFNELKLEPGNRSIGPLLKELAPRMVFPRTVWAALKTIQSYGNVNAHDVVSESGRTAPLACFQDL